jgi:hypothetical protein
MNEMLTAIQQIDTALNQWRASAGLTKPVDDLPVTQFTMADLQGSPGPKFASPRQC